ncbi:endonuclease VII domain-containing protein [Streptomyces sp. NPDC051597]|uniref:endonuclease VII domain-containing protein n=1 Tax=Streptomyces sp. NPDC051597 TaxID=3155049 RepID=UPI003430FFCB
MNAKSLAWYRNNRERALRNHREYNLRSLYGISESDFQDLLATQGGKCALCPMIFANIGRRNLCVDHDHVTGRVRGLLCRRCNSSIGQLGDDVDGLRRALAYVESADPFNRVGESAA